MNEPTARKLMCLVSGLAAAGMVVCGGCAIVGLVATPTRHEEKIRAEYNLSQLADKRMLVLVRQPAWLNAQANFRYYLTRELNVRLSEKTKLSASQLIGYDTISRFRAGRADFSILSGTEVARQLGADVVLEVVIDDCRLVKVTGADYYSAWLSARCTLHRADTAEKLWPASTDARTVKVGFEIGPSDRTAALLRATGAMAYCVVRYFYDCPLDQFKIGDDRTEQGWRDWK